MKQFREFIGGALVSGLLVLAPTYLAVLLLLRAMKSLAGLVRPIAALLPEWMPGETVLALLMVLALCLLIGVFIRTRRGRRLTERVERTVFVKIPGYTLVRGLTRQMAGDERESSWKPALVELEDALVPAFIIEELPDGRCTVFVPSAPSPFAGAIYIMTADRIHRVNATFLETFQTIGKWGSGAKHLVASMERESQVPVR